MHQAKKKRDETLKWGILSTARVNRRIIPPINTAERSEVVGVASRDLARARKFSRRWKIPLVFNSYQALLDSPEINVIYLPLPNQLHCEWAIRAVRAGKHVLCEKPLALSESEVEKMIRAAGENKVILLEGLAYRMHPQFIKLKELIGAGTIGPVELIRAHYSFTLPREKGNIRWKRKLGGGCLWDVGCYPVSFARAIVGSPPAEVYAFQKTGATGVDIFFAGQLIFPNGIVAQIDCGFCEPYRAGAEVVGQNGVIYLPNPWQPDVEGKKSGIIRISPDDHESIIPTRVIDPYLCEIMVMEEAVLEGRPPPFLLAESRDNITTISALAQSAGSKKAVKVSGRRGLRGR